jgi:hypothetical protein
MQHQVYIHGCACAAQGSHRAVRAALSGRWRRALLTPRYSELPRPMPGTRPPAGAGAAGDAAAAAAAFAGPCSAASASAASPVPVSAPVAGHEAVSTRHAQRALVKRLC